MTLRRRVRFYQQLAVLARAGVPLRTNLARMQERSPGKELAVLVEKVDAGERLGDAFAQAGFSPFECHLVSAAERSGRFETIFQHLSEYWARQLEMRQDFIAQLYYPGAVLHLALLMAAFAELITGSWTQVEIRLVEYFGGLYTIIFIGFISLRVLWRSKGAQRFWLHVPVVGRALSTAFAYRWITALRIEFSAGITLSNTVADAWRASGYVDGEGLAVEGQQGLREGKMLSALVQHWRRLPRDWADFIETGELSGGLESAFTSLEAEAARAYAMAQQRMAQWLPKIASFLIMVVIGAVIIQIVYRAYLMPIIELEK